MSGISRTAKMFDVTTANSVIMPEPQRVPVEKVSFLAKHIFSTLITKFSFNDNQLRIHTEQMFCQKSNKPGRGKVKQLPAEIKMDNE